MLQRILAIIQKEFSQALRDRATLMIIIAMPFIQLIIFGYAINTNIRHIATVVVDQSMDEASRSYLNDMVNSSYFDIVENAPDQASAIQSIDTSRTHVAIVIPPDFAEHVQRGDAQVLILVDGSDLFTSQAANSFAAIIGQEHAIKIIANQVAAGGSVMAAVSMPSLDARLRVLYNPDMKDLWFIIPGMAAMLLQTQVLTLTSSAVVKERETGTIEQILVTPIRPLELMIGKVVPFIVLSMLNMVTVIAIGVFWFGVPFMGSFWLFIGLSFLYVFSGLGLGLLLSSISQNQRQSQQLMMLFLMVGLILGGFMFPRYTMPPAIQALGNLFPMTYFIPIARGIITKGVGFSVLTDQVVWLSVYIVIVMVLATVTFKQKLD